MGRFRCQKQEHVAEPVRPFALKEFLVQFATADLELLNTLSMLLDQLYQGVEEEVPVHYLAHSLSLPSRIIKSQPELLYPHIRLIHTIAACSFLSQSGKPF